ncbi:MAG: AAA family ATPase [Planctomycetes bacterium]|nr:AAA family ATPase [Planctomycetota bacterium]
MAKNSKNSEKNAQNVVDIVDDLLEKAALASASDVHFEPTTSGLIVKFRLDGILNIIEKLPNSLSDNVIARLKVLGGLLTYRNDVPQEGRIQVTGKYRRNILDQRLAIFPTIHGQRAVVRLFYENNELTELENLGFGKNIEQILKNICTSNQGVLLLTGPAGAGKSTTLVAMLRHILKNQPGKSIVTLEDPVERAVEGVTQIQITPYGEMTFPTALRSLLRQDPEVLMVGEIRDAQTAKIVIEAALTGHLLMSTLHSGSCAGAFLRLLEMGAEPYQITSSITAVLNQRLLRRLCQKCKTRDGQTGLYHAIGCEDCFKTGYKGRALICEIVQMDGQLRQAIISKADSDELNDILNQRGHMTMLQNGAGLVADGITTQKELNKVCGVA